MGFLIRSTLPYKVYSAELTQNGINAPSASVFQNTLGNITYNYNGPGSYSILSTNLFVPSKTFILFNLSKQGLEGPSIINSFIFSDSNIVLISYEFNAAVPKFYENNDILNGFLEIRVYN